MIIHVKSYDEFKNLIASSDCFVDFFATWCGPCKMLTPVIEEMDEKGAFGDVKILKIDVDEVGPLAARFGIQAIPTLILFKDGQQVDKRMGYQNMNQLLAFINQ